ncbi:MAG: hypothetical protein GX422_14265 [Deltaproteobacteria bacterium]|nr:hypothetical protein [Deltaproteobacteria bacterium]
MTHPVKLRFQRELKEHRVTIEWKGALWRSVRNDLSIGDLLSTMKGYGPMEIIEFVKPGHWRGRMSLGYAEKGCREVTLLELVIHGEKRQGKGRQALRWLKRTFNAELYAQDFGAGQLADGLEGSFPFWMKMFREGLLEGVEGEICSLHRGMSDREIDEMEEKVKRFIAAQESESKRT